MLQGVRCGAGGERDAGDDAGLSCRGVELLLSLLVLLEVVDVVVLELAVLLVLTERDRRGSRGRCSA